MQINIAGLSTHSCLALDKYINDNDIAIVAVSESYGEITGFENYMCYMSNESPKKHSSALFIHKKYSSYQINYSEREGVDCCFAVLTVHRK